MPQGGGAARGRRRSHNRRKRNRIATTRPHPGRSKQGVLEPRTLPLINAQSFGPLTSDICRGMARAWLELSFSGRAAGIRAAA